MEPNPPTGDVRASITNLRSRLPSTTMKMAAVGARIGSPTGLCEPFVLDMLGAQVDFSRVTSRDLERYRRQADLLGYPITVDSRVPLQTTVQTILEQQQAGVRVLYVSGKATHELATGDEEHMIAVVKGNEGKYAIIDSLSRTGLEEVDGTQGVIDRISGRFSTVTRGLTYSVVFTDEEKAARRGDGKSARGRKTTQNVGNGVFI